MQAGRAHLGYIQREGAGRGGKDGKLFGPERGAEIAAMGERLGDVSCEIGRDRRLKR